MINNDVLDQANAMRERLGLERLEIYFTPNDLTCENCKFCEKYIPHDAFGWRYKCYLVFTVVEPNWWCKFRERKEE